MGEVNVGFASEALRKNGRDGLKGRIASNPLVGVADVCRRFPIQRGGAAARAERFPNDCEAVLGDWCWMWNTYWVLCASWKIRLSLMSISKMLGGSMYMPKATWKEGWRAD